MAAALADSELLARLVAFDTTSSKSNISIADFICDYLDDPQIEIVRIPSADGNKVNLMARIGGAGNSSLGPAGRDHRGGLVLSGHLDVVPANEPGWRSEPFALTETDDAYVGRGACDMKGFVALAINIARAAVGWKLNSALVLILSYDEEVGSFGVKRIADTWDNRFELPTSTIVGEPTSLRAVRMHKGHLKMRVTLTGQGAHSGYPHLGKNAIEPAGRIVTALSELRRTLQQERSELSEFFPQTPYVALNVAQICGGEAINIVPDRCTIDLGVRVLPGMDSAAMIERVRHAIEAVEDRGDCEVDVLHDNPPMLLAEDSQTNRKLCGLLPQTVTYSASYASDAGMLQRMGLECVLCGPGTIEVAHKPNESMPKRDFVAGKELIERAVRSFCTE